MVNEGINVSFKNNIFRDVYIEMKRFKFDLLFTLGIAVSDLEKKNCLKLFHFTLSSDKSLLIDLFAKASLSMT